MEICPAFGPASPDHGKLSCVKRTCRGPVCWQHAQKQHGLRVKPSQIQNAGFGLYATKRLARNARIAPYTGELRTRDQITQEYGTDTGQYVLCRSDGGMSLPDHPLRPSVRFLTG